MQWNLGATLEIKHSNRKMSPSFDLELDKFNFRLEVWSGPSISSVYPCVCAYIFTLLTSFVYFYIQLLLRKEWKIIWLLFKKLLWCCYFNQKGVELSQKRFLKAFSGRNSFIISFWWKWQNKSFNFLVEIVNWQFFVLKWKHWVPINLLLLEVVIWINIEYIL